MMIPPSILQTGFPTLLAWLAIAGAAGACLRYGVDRLAHRLIPTALPVGILVVNLSGALFIGLLAGILTAHTGTTGSAWAGDVDPEYHTTWVILSVGFAGSYTTFSGWMVQTAELVEAGDLKDALLNLLLSIVPGILLTLAGIRIGMML